MTLDTGHGCALWIIFWIVVIHGVALGPGWIAEMLQ